MKHTCILDDGGTPGRRCAACDAEKQQLPHHPVKGWNEHQTLEDALLNVVHRARLYKLSFGVSVEHSIGGYSVVTEILQTLARYQPEPVQVTSFTKATELLSAFVEGHMAGINRGYTAKAEGKIGSFETKAQEDWFDSRARHTLSPNPAPTREASCLDCGLPYEAFPLDVLLPRPQWLAIHPQENGLLCAQCIMTRVKAKISGATAVHAIVEVQQLQQTEQEIFRAGFEKGKENAAWRSDVGDGFQSAAFCQHANEAPSGGRCTCPYNCSCRKSMCRTIHFEGGLHDVSGGI